MMQLRFWILLFCTLTALRASAYSESSGNQLIYGEQFWTLPATECDSPNFCEVRISPQGTIYGWDKVNFRLYISRLNTSTYELYDLSIYAGYLNFVTDFIVFDELGYVVMYSPVGASRTLSRYNLHTRTFQIIEFPDDYNLVGCNHSTGVNQITLRLIFQLGLDGRFLACTDSPQDNPIIHIIDVNTLTIEQSLNINARFIDVIQPLWIVAGGLDNKIYAIVRNPEATIPNLPKIDETTQEIILIYDVANQLWSYKVKPSENTYEVLAVLPNEEGIFFRNGTEIIQFDSNFQIVRRIPSAGRFQGMTINGDIFFSTGTSYSDISIINVNNYPLLDVNQ